MTWNKHNEVNEPPSGDWGGPWTEKKLQAFSKYVAAYLTIMKKFPYWETIYFDGFAGSGTKEEEVQSELYKQLKITEQEEKTYKGAAERVLTLKDDLAFNSSMELQSTCIPKGSRKINAASFFSLL